MKRTTIITYIIAGAILMTAFIYSSCSTSSVITEKSGSQLWSENCMRCHNTPTPSAYTDEEWETIGTHMRVRANMTEDEINKIVEFLKSGN